MAKFKIKDTENHLSEFFEVEAETKEEAIDKYVNELAGSLERFDFNYDPDAEDEIVVID
jgi:hypothetical protein